jgi:hypothetical protein
MRKLPEDEIKTKIENISKMLKISNKLKIKQQNYLVEKCRE